MPSVVKEKNLSPSCFCGCGSQTALVTHQERPRTRATSDLTITAWVGLEVGSHARTSVLESSQMPRSRWQRPAFTAIQTEPSNRSWECWVGIGRSVFSCCLSVPSHNDLFPPSLGAQTRQGYPLCTLRHHPWKWTCTKSPQKKPLFYACLGFSKVHDRNLMSKMM